MRGHYGSDIDHDTELMRGYDDDGFGHCYNCDEPFSEDGPTCECEFKHVLSILADQGDGRYAWRVHGSYKTEAEAYETGERLKLLNDHVKGVLVCQDPPDEEDEDEFDEEEDFEDDDEDADELDDDDMDDDEITDAMLEEVWLRR